MVIPPADSMDKTHTAWSAAATAARTDLCGWWWQLDDNWFTCIQTRTLHFRA